MIRKSFTIVIFFLFLTHFSYSQNIEFYKEDLSFEIKNNYFYVDGIYHFCNVSDKPLKNILLYPFPQDSAYGHIDSVQIEEIGNKKNVLIRYNNKNALFKVNLESYGIKKYKIAYRQKLLEQKAEYILTTTQQWNKPFENASYKLIVPKSLEIDSISYKEDSIKIIQDKIYYFWKKKNFMPYKNFIVYFKSPKK
ncbi:MAG: DUF4424 family protein [Bacteroidales bacterium]|nr:DUF4424 family protein [Bacteroidales bacterium]